MTQTADLIHKMAEFFKSEDFFEKGEDARLELSPDDVRCMNEVIKACGDAVSRQAVLNGLTSIAKTKAKSDAQKSLMGRVMFFTEQLPSVRPQLKTGHWIVDVDKWGDVITTVNGYRCDKCNAFNTDRDNFCPNCGAKMEVENNG